MPLVADTLANMLRYWLVAGAFKQSVSQNFVVTDGPFLLLQGHHFNAYMFTIQTRTLEQVLHMDPSFGQAIPLCGQLFIGQKTGTKDYFFHSMFIFLYYE